jgi:hypothetical protein
MFATKLDMSPIKTIEIPTRTKSISKLVHITYLNIIKLVVK